MRALSHARETDQRPCGHGACTEHQTSPAIPGDEGECDEPEADGRVTGGEGAVPLASRRGQGRRREDPRAPELGNLRRARASPVVLEEAIDGEAGPQREDQKDVNALLRSDAKRWAPAPPLHRQQQRNPESLRGHDPGHYAIERSHDPGLSEEEALAWPKENAACPEI